MLDLGGLDVEEMASALADKMGYEHRWLLDPRSGQVAFWTSDTGIDGVNPRWAAAAGAVLALTFFLTVSWNTTPYYYGADIVFLFAWTPFITTGAGGVLSADAWLAARTAAHARRGLPLDRAQPRRVVLITGVATVTLAALTAAVGRLVARSPNGAAAAPAISGNQGGVPNAAASPKPANPQPNQPPSAPAPSGTRIASVSSLPAGRAVAFTDPASGGPAWVYCRANGEYSAHSAVCTHTGCTVDFDTNARELVAPATLAQIGRVRTYRRG